MERDCGPVSPVATLLSSTRSAPRAYGVSAWWSSGGCGRTSPGSRSASPTGTPAAPSGAREPRSPGLLDRPRSVSHATSGPGQAQTNSAPHQSPPPRGGTVAGPRRLRLSRKSAYAWHARWRDGGVSALRSKGPAARGWVEDQRWTLGRFRSRGLPNATRTRWPRGSKRRGHRRKSVRLRDAGLCFAGWSGQLLRRRRHVPGPGAPRPQGREEGLSGEGLRCSAGAAHRQISEPVVLVRDNYTHHVNATMRELIASRQTDLRFPSYTPAPNPGRGCGDALVPTRLSARSTSPACSTASYPTALRPTVTNADMFPQISAPFRAASTAAAAVREPAAEPRRTPSPHRTACPSSSRRAPARSPPGTVRSSSRT